jgi:hypothetical protein
MVEAASNEDKDSAEVRNRESLVTHQFWYSFLKRRLDLER